MLHGFAAMGSPARMRTEDRKSDLHFSKFLRVALFQTHEKNAYASIKNVVNIYLKPQLRKGNYSSLLPQSRKFGLPSIKIKEATN